MRSFIRAAILLPAAAFSAGCSGQTVRDGIWELSFDLAFVDTGESVSDLVRSREVLVRSTSDSRGEEVIEVIEIAPLSRIENVSPMYGEIRSGHVSPKPIITIMHTDRDWAWQMFGYVRDDESIVGNRFYGRTKHEQLVLEGRWEMKWLRDT